jgi:glycosyltransferase involved in cell wall biosynthesis
MYKGMSVSLVIPAYNEEKLIKPTLMGVPDVVDRIYVIDDCSTDETSRIVQGVEDDRVVLIRHRENQGPGGAIITGYKMSAKDNIDIAVVVGGDNQMGLEEIENFLEPIHRGEADYVKGNRFLLSLKDMPGHRLFGNSVLSMMTKIASGYWKVFDTQDGYTAINRKAIEAVDWDSAWKGYGYVSDFLVRLNVHNFRVKDVPRKAVYLPNERQSQINIGRYVFKVLPMLISGFFWRLKEKYIVRDFHPLVLFYILGLTALPIGSLMGLWLVWHRIFIGTISGTTALLAALLIIAGLQSLFFAIHFDMEQSK